MPLNLKCHLTWRCNSTIAEVFQRVGRRSNYKVTKEGHLQCGTNRYIVKDYRSEERIDTERPLRKWPCFTETCTELQKQTINIWISQKHIR